MKSLAEFEKKYESLILQIWKKEDVTFAEARMMLIYMCREAEQGEGIQGTAMNFGALTSDFNFGECLDDFNKAIRNTSQIA